jgi:hypothetical protein
MCAVVTYIDVLGLQSLAYRRISSGSEGTTCVPIMVTQSTSLLSDIPSRKGWALDTRHMIRLSSLLLLNPFTYWLAEMRLEWCLMVIQILERDSSELCTRIYVLR